MRGGIRRKFPGHALQSPYSPLRRAVQYISADLYWPSRSGGDGLDGRWVSALGAGFFRCAHSG